MEAICKMSLKKIHRIYFGFDGKPDMYQSFLENWKEKLPEYEIVLWNAENLPINNCYFSKLMYEYKDHAFLSDYFRWWILKNHGGIYLDADIEIVNADEFRKIVDDLAGDDSFHSVIGIDNKSGGWYTAHSMATKKNSPLAEFMVEIYESLGPISEWRRKIFYMMAPQLTALYFAKLGWNKDGMGTSPNLNEAIIRLGVKIYPQEVFSPMTPIVIKGRGDFLIDAYTEKTAICHHFSCSWHEDDSIYKKTNADRTFISIQEQYNSKAQKLKFSKYKFINFVKGLIR